MSQELAGRALSGGDPGGYDVRCALDRFAVRSRDAHHRQRGAPRALRRRLVRGEARIATARSSGAASCAAALAPRGATSSAAAWGSPSVSSTAHCRTRRARWRATSLSGRSALRAAPSARAFADESEQRAGSGLDDTPWGAAALEENADAVEHALRTLDTHDTDAARGGVERGRDGGGPGRPVARGRQDGARRRAARALRAVQGARAARRRRGDGSATRRSRQGGGRRSSPSSRATRSRPAASASRGRTRTNASAATNGATTSP